jgi:FKBP-type peptidyl-prolyl cis-trans isomerase
VSKIIIALIIVAGLAAYFYFSSGNDEAALRNIQLGKDFLEGNKQNSDVMETVSGLQYLLLEKGEGEGEDKPLPSDRVKVHYHGTLIDGSVFDSSVERGQPIDFSLNQVIKGWTEGLQLMSVGDKMRFFIPSHLAYGNRGAGRIQPGSMLIFDVELIAINE